MKNKRPAVGQNPEDELRPTVTPDELAEAYAKMAADRVRESEALEWSEGLISDASD